MYEPFFGLRDKPVNVTPDPRYLYLSESHEEALAALLYGIRERKGLVTLTGPVGVGKTTVLFSFFDRIRRETEIAFFPGGVTGSRVDFFRELCKQFELPAETDSLFDLTRSLQEFTARKLREGRNVIVLVDEAQDLGVEELNHFRYLNNLETPDAKFLQIVLAGMPQLDEKLRDERLLSLRQRIAVRCVIQPLDPAASVAYILHRLRVAGNDSGTLFTPGAVRRIVNYAQGVPRRINVLCDNALIIAYALRKAPVEEAFVVEALEGMEGKAWAAEGKETVSLEEAEALLRRAAGRPRAEAGRQGPPPEEAWAGDGRVEKTSGPRAPAGAGGPEAYPRTVSVRHLQEGMPARSGPRTAVVVSAILAACVLAALLLHLFLGRERTRPSAPPPVAEAPMAEPLAVEPPAAEPPAAEPAEPPPVSRLPQAEEPPPPGMLTGDAGVAAEREEAGADAVEEAPDPHPPAPAGDGRPGQQAAPQAEAAQSGRDAPRTLWAAALAGYGTLTLPVLQDLKARNPGVPDWNRLEPGAVLRLPEAAETARAPVDFYSVQVVSFRQERNIRRSAERLCARGNQNVFVLRSEPDPAAGDVGRWYSCCVGVFASEADAAGWEQKMRGEGFSDAFVVRIRGVPLPEVLFPCPGEGAGG